MGTKRRYRGRHRRTEIHPDMIAILSDREPDNRFWHFSTDDELLVAWGEVGGEILDAWIADSPGTRPSFWWRFDAPRQSTGNFPGCCYDGRLPEPRRRVGGTGTPNFEVLSYGPSYSYGIPDGWVSKWDADYYNGRSRDNDGRRIGTDYAEGNFAGVPIDPSDPPAFESQASYLDRHGLFLPGEKKRLRKCDWQPEFIMPQEEDDETEATPDAA